MSLLISYIKEDGHKGFQDEVKDVFLAHRQDRKRHIKYEEKRMWEIQSPAQEKRRLKMERSYYYKKEQISFYVRYVLSKNKIPINKN